MFEADTLSFQDCPLAAAPDALRQTYHRRHQPSLRPLTIWIAQGKRKDCQGRPRPTLFVYTEYRDDRGQRRYCCQEHGVDGQSAAALLAQAIKQPLPGVASRGA